MVTIENLEALDPLVMKHIERQIAERKLTTADDGLTGLGFTRAAMKRAAMYFARFISCEDRHAESAGRAFGFTWMVSERETFQRIMTAISSPTAKGREAEVVEAMMRGASVEEALAKRDSVPVTESGNVVALHPQRVASTTAND